MVICAVFYNNSIGTNRHMIAQDYIPNDTGAKTKVQSVTDNRNHILIAFVSDAIVSV